MGTPAVKLYNGLDGKDLQTSILENHKRAMQADTNFNISLAYHNVEFETVTTIRCYPREPAEFKARSMGTFEEPEFKPDPEEKPVVLVTRSSKKIVSPDKEREELGLGIPTPTMKDGVIVDERKTGRNR